jgi:hypothetical protein
MWAHRPPLPVALLASRVGVDRSTLVSWLTTDRHPQPLQLLIVAQVTALSVDDLAQAAGVPVERIPRQRQTLYDYVIWDVERTAPLADDDRASLTSALRAVREAAHWQTSAGAPSRRDGAGADVTRLDATTDGVGER